MFHKAFWGLLLLSRLSTGFALAFIAANFSDDALTNFAEIDCLWRKPETRPIGLVAFPVPCLFISCGLVINEDACQVRAIWHQYGFNSALIIPPR